MKKRWGPALVVLGGIALVEGALYGLWGHLDGNDRFPTLEQQAAFVAGVGLFLMPHVLALLSRGRSRAVLAGAGVCAVTIGVLSLLDPVIFLGGVLVELIPGIVYLVRAAQPGPGTKGKAFLGIVLPVLLVGAIASIVLISEVRCYTYVRYRDGTYRYHSVPAPENGGYGSGRMPADGPNIIESGGGCGDTQTFKSSIPALALMGTAIGIGIFARRGNQDVITAG